MPRTGPFILVAIAITISVVAMAASPTATVAESGDWRTDPIWHDGKAEWALYDAVRPIYGVPRRYEATIFTNTQHQDPATTVKAVTPGAGTVEVFKHNLSEMIPTEHYTYRFLTTCFVERATLETMKIVFSSQEDCGATYKQFVVTDDAVAAESFCYFPAAGTRRERYDTPVDLAFHDALSLTLRDYPFDDASLPTIELDLVPDQTDTHATLSNPAAARVEHAGRETLSLPYGSVDSHHLRVTHQRDGGTRETNYWFAAEPGMQRVMVQYRGPYGVEYRLKRFGRWAYWNRGEAAPR
ncbi:MAG: hypothetical protein HKO59_16390 [Phycisphaerales bacterium]|nr:hypothetical protein [Phycisphaerales bacterium]